MAYVPKFKCDIYVSFAHLDDVAIGNSPPWVSAFVSDLEKMLRIRLGVSEAEGLKVRFTGHTSIAAGVSLDATLENVSSAAIFLAVTSPAYVVEEWTMRELATFRNAATADGRMFVIEHQPLDAIDEYPAPLNEIKRMAFWSKHPERGIPITMPTGSNAYMQRLVDLVEQIRSTLKNLKQARTPVAATRRSEPAPARHITSSEREPRTRAAPELAAAAPKQAQCKVVISYRRSDSEGMAGRIFDRLVNHLGEASVFIDVDNIPFGADFRAHIAKELEGCDVVFAIMGPNWVGPTEGGQRRIDQERDYVRMEIEAALRKEVTIVPLLVHGAQMLDPDDLPDGLKLLAYKNAANMDSGADFRHHMDRLLRWLDKHLAERQTR